MNPRLVATGITLGLAVPLLALTNASPAAAACAPDTAPAYAGDVPTGQEVLGYEIGSQEASVEDIAAYLAAVDDASDDVSVGSFGTSTGGRPLEYAVVGDPADVEAAQEASAALRDPATTPEEAATIADQAPAIVWMAANVHGNEPSGADAALVMLRDLADRTDCAAGLVRDETVTVIIPTQNPDGREVGFRRNLYGFDLNRDWFARTQAETDGKLDLLMDYPPVLMSDNHEMGGRGFFFPPNADPVHHEVADRSVRWINKLYGGAMTEWFEREGWNFFNYSVYDLLYMGYGDTVPTTQLNAASMTYEKGGDSPIRQRTDEQFGATFASMYALAERKDSVLRGLASSYRQAAAEGAAGELEPNAVFAPGSELQLQVPRGKVRHYFLRDTPATADQLQEVVGLLQDAGVEVDRLAQPVDVPDFTPYGEDRRAVTLPAGTWHVSMAQGQKHWIQAMLGEDSYVPFPYFYDVTAWSLPLLGDLDGGRSGRDLDLVTTPAPPVGDVPAHGTPPGSPRVGLLKLGPGVTAYESQGWTRWLLEQKWELDHQRVRRDSIATGGLDDIDVLLVPGGNARIAAEAMGRDGRRALRQWVADGGRYVGWRGGTSLAIRLGLTSARFEEPTSDVPGSLLRTVGRKIPLLDGVGPKLFTFYEYDGVMTAPRASVAVRYPQGDRFFVSGFSRGAGELRGTAAVVAEKYADGRMVLFAGDPNFRAFTTGTQKLVWNAITVDDPSPDAPDASRLAPGRRVSGSGDASRLTGLGTITVPSASGDAVAAALGRGARISRLPGGLVRVTWPVGDVDGRSVLAGVLGRLGPLADQVVAARVP